jgi:hypothetical protein
MSHGNAARWYPAYHSRRSHGAKPRSATVRAGPRRSAAKVKPRRLRSSGRIGQMKRERWTDAPPEADLGAVAYGPVVLARSGGVAVGLRCVFAHRTGLHLPLVLLANAVHAEAAARQTGHQPAPPGYRPSEPPGWSHLQVLGELNGRVGEMLPYAATTSGGLDRYTEQAEYWIGELPRDGLLRLTVAWPRIGLSAATTTVQLDPPGQLATGAITLLPP